MDMFERRRVYIKCLQEVRYMGRGVYGGEENYKFWWSTSEEGRNGVGIMRRRSRGDDFKKLKDWMIE